MADVGTIQPHPQRRSRHFPSWIKKLASFKKTESKKKSSHSVNPRRSPRETGQPSTQERTISSSAAHRSQSQDNTVNAAQAPQPIAPHTSIAADHDHTSSDVAQSHGTSSAAGTTFTIGPGKDAGSTFSSPAPSERSLTTTLTTIHSANTPLGTSTLASPSLPNQTTNTAFAHQFPSSPHPTAIPAHLAPNTSGGHPATYQSLTANNLLTDNASILTLASSSKRRRRRSMDTDASVRAMAPSSLFGGSRESLPLGALNTNIDSGSLQPGVHGSRQAGGGAAERVSIYSASGIAPALPSDRNSYYAGRERTIGDGVSVKSGMSGLYGHGRTESLSGSASVLGANSITSPLASPTMIRGTT